MTLKSFFLAEYGTFSRYRENMKRRSWVCLLCVLVLTLALPVRHAMQINANLQRMEQNLDYFSTVMPPMDRVRQMFMNALAEDVLTAFVIVGMAVIFAVQGFSWQNQSRKLDLYMSVPVSSRSRFTYIYLNGIWFFALTYLVSMLLTVTVASLMGVGSIKIFGAALLIWLGNMVFYIACYNLTLVAVMLTGKVLVTLCGTVVLFGYEYLVRSLFDYLRRTFFRTYSGFSEVSSHTLTSPIYTWVECVSEGYGWFSGDLAHPDALLKGVGIWTVQAVVYGLAVWFLYRKRKAEAAGKAMAFGISKPIVKFALVIPSALLLALWFWELSDESIVFAGIGLAVGILVGHSLIQVIYEADIRSIISKKWQLGFVGAASILIFVWFYMDLSGYDSYLPGTDDIDEVAVAFPDDIYTIRLYDNLFEEDMQHANRTEYMLEHMKTQDPETIGAILQLARMDMDQKIEEMDYDEDQISMIIRYGLKNGDDKYRTIIVECEKAEPQLDAVFEDDSFRNARYQVKDPGFVRNKEKIQIAFDNGMDSLNYLEDVSELLQIYAEEFENYNYSMIRKELPLGILQITYYPKGTDMQDDSFHWGYPVYPGFEKTISLLSENGAYFERQENGSFIRTEDVVSVTITGFNLIEETMVNDLGEAVTLSQKDGEAVVETYSDKEDIEAILPAVYPENLLDIAGINLRRDLNSDHYSVSVTFSNDVAQSMQNRYFMILEDKLPEYVKEKLVYKMKTE